MSESQDDCHKFPPGETFCRQYSERMPNNKYLAEKTCPVVSDMLAGRSGVLNMSIDDAAWSGVQDFNYYICSGPKVTPQCVAVHMNSDMHIEQIKRTLLDMSEKCPCRKTGSFPQFGNFF